LIGMGKTDIALSIAAYNASRKKRVAYFALEAEPLELERRMKFRRILRLLFDSRRESRDLSGTEDVTYGRWMAGLCEEITKPFAQLANQWMLETISTLETLYRGKHFTADNLASVIRSTHERFDLIVIDHLHYIDAADGMDENRALAETTKTLRDVALEIGKPVLLVAHLRKKDSRSKKLISEADDFHGSSNVTKIATQVITLDRAWNVEAPRWWYAPTFMSVVKERRDGADGYVAVMQYDKRKRTYSRDYTIGRIGEQGWEAVEQGQQPRWATSHTRMEAIL